MLASRVATVRGYTMSVASGAMRRVTASVDGAVAGEAKEAGRSATAKILWALNPVIGHAVDPVDL